MTTPETCGTGWYSEESIEILYESEDVLSIKIVNDSYGGGAHPSKATRYANLRKPTGKEIQISDILVKAAEPELKRLITQQLRKTDRIPEGQSLTDNGYFTNLIEVTPNFTINSSGLIFDYGETISSHAHGAVVVEIPYAAIHSLERPNARVP